MPTTCPRLLIAVATLLNCPPRLPRSVGEPFRQITACEDRANPKTLVDPQNPDPPAATSRSLVPNAADTASPDKGRRSWLFPSLQRTPWKSNTCGTRQFGSTTVSAQPTICPDLLLLLA